MHLVSKVLSYTIHCRNEIDEIIILFSYEMFILNNQCVLKIAS